MREKINKKERKKERRSEAKKTKDPTHKQKKKSLVTQALINTISSGSASPCVRNPPFCSQIKTIIMITVVPDCTPKSSGTQTTFASWKLSYVGL